MLRYDGETNQFDKLVYCLLAVYIYLKTWKVREFKQGKGNEVGEGIAV